MQYRTVAQLDDAVVSWLGALPRDIDLVAGMPRSGLLVANLLALHLNVPMTDVAGLVEGRVISAGARYKGSDPHQFLSKPRHVLVVDDSVCSGSAMQRVKETLRNAALPHRMTYAAVYMSPEVRFDSHVDLYRELVAMPRVFEWNLMHSTVLANSCMDIDGVLCLDPTDHENDDGARYERFLRFTPALMLPTSPVGWLVTSRLEKYRALTEEWLARHNVRFGELRMMQYPGHGGAPCGARLRAIQDGHAYEETGAWLFIESDARDGVGDRARSPVAPCSAPRRARCCSRASSPRPRGGRHRRRSRRWVPPCAPPRAPFGNGCAGPPDWAKL